jgi:hypothetical protein
MRGGSSRQSRPLTRSFGPPSPRVAGRGAIVALLLLLAPALFGASADLGITQFYVDNRTTHATGDRISVNIFWRNFGPDTAEIVTVEFGKDSGAFFITGGGTEHWPCQPTLAGGSFVCRGHLEPGAEAHMVATLRTPAHGTSFSITGTITAATPDPVPANNTQTLTFGLTPTANHAELSISPTTQTVRGQPGSEVALPLQVTNSGPATARDLIAMLNFGPENLVRVSASGNGWKCENPEDAPWVVLCMRPELASGVTAPIVLRTTMPETGTAQLGARVTAARGYDTNPANDSMFATLDTGVIVEPPPPVPWKRILVPLGPSEAAGENGARWKVETTLRGPATPLRPGLITQFLYTVDEPHVHLNSRVWDTARETLTAGSEIPVVREADFRSTTLSLLGIPVAPHYRHTLRVYDFDGRGGARVAIRVYANDETTPRANVERTLLVQTGEKVTDAALPLVSAYLQLDPGTLGSLEGAGTIRVEVEPLDAGLRLWSFVSVTNNQTHHVTTFSAQ